MDENWIVEYRKTAGNALTAEWFVSPLEYSWPNGKAHADQIFSSPSTQNAIFDELVAPQLYKIAMEFGFRAKMMVYAFMRESIARTYSLEIEGGIISLFGLDFMSCLTQWIHVVEGYCRQLFQVSSLSNVKSTSWTIPATGDPIRDKAINVTCKALADYLDTIVYQSTNDAQTTKLNRHLLLHGNLQNKAFYSQKNALSVMFVLDALVFIEMVKNKHFPQIFHDGPDEADRIKRRMRVYQHEMQNSLLDPNLLKISLMDEHV